MHFPKVNSFHIMVQTLKMGFTNSFRNPKIKSSYGTEALVHLSIALSILREKSSMRSESMLERKKYMNPSTILLLLLKCIKLYSIKLEVEYR